MTRIVMAVAAAYLIHLAFPPMADAEKLTVYTAENNVNTKNKPGTAASDWDELPKGGKVVVTKGDVIYLGFRNQDDYKPENAKEFIINFRADVGQNLILVTIKKIHGYQLKTKAKLAPPPTKNKKKGKAIATLITTHYNFDTCPEWEWLQVKNNTNADVEFSIDAVSNCYEKDDDLSPKQDIRDWSVGEAGAMYGSQQVVEVWLSPDEQTVDTGVSPGFTGPVGSGNWTHEFVSLDPWGGTRSQGVVKWTSDGVGIAAGEKFDTDLTLVSSVDDSYSVWVYDSETGEYDTHGVSTPVEGVPALPGWGLPGLLLLLLGVGMSASRRMD